MGSAGILIASLFLVAACVTPPDAPPSLARDVELACSLAPKARQIPAELRVAAAAAQRKDQGSMTKAAERAVLLGNQITDATGALSREGFPTDALGAITVVGIFGQQGGFVFEEEIPDHDGLASFQASLPALDQALARVEADLAKSGAIGC